MKTKIKVLGLSVIASICVVMSGSKAENDTSNEVLSSLISDYDNYLVENQGTNLVSPTINTAFVIEELMQRRTRMIDMRNSSNDFENQIAQEASLYMRELDNIKL